MESDWGAGGAGSGEGEALAAVSGPAVGLVVVDRSLFGLLAGQKFYGGF